MSTRVVRTREQRNRGSSPSHSSSQINRTDTGDDASHHQQPLSLPLPLPTTGSRSRPLHTSAPAPSATTTPTTTNRDASTTLREHSAHTPPSDLFSRWTTTSNVFRVWPGNVFAEHEPDSDDDDNSLPPLRTSQRGEANIDDDASYLAAFADGEFSSPSTYPPFTQTTARQTEDRPDNNPENASGSMPALPTRPPLILPPLHSLPRTPAPRDPSNTYWPAYLPRPQPTPAPRTASQLSSSTNASSSRPRPYLLDSFDGSVIQFTPQSPFSSDTMPQTRRQSREAAQAPHLDAHPNKRRRTSVNPSPRAQAKTTPSKPRRSHRASKDVDSLFGSPRARTRTPDAEARDELPTIDLTEATEVPEELKKPVEDNRVKLSAFQCVICMDDVTSLTVTHCGHLYCAQCLHSSLHVDVTKGKCPMCRQKLDMKSREQYNSKTKGYWPLELKLMTATRKGKRKANNPS